MNSLALLIPYTFDIQQLYERVYKQLIDQISYHPVTVLSYPTPHSNHGGPSTGIKRNWLLDRARDMRASHIAFIDSDDLIGPNYIEAVMPGVYGDYDCCELWGQYYVLGKPGMPFHHSIIHKEWWQDDKAYYRNPNHLSVIKLEHLHDIRFQDKTVGEDGHYSIDIQKTGRLKKEYPIKEIIYHYFDGDKARKNHAIEPMIAEERGTKL